MGVDLIVMRAVGEGCALLDEVADPRRIVRVWQVDVASLDEWTDGGSAGDFAALWIQPRLPPDGGAFCTAENRFGLVHQLPAVLMQGTILPGELVGRVLHHLPAALVKILTLVHQLLTRVDQVIRDFFSLAA